jgi:phosphotransferase system HPr (HPr) family protein
MPESSEATLVLPAPLHARPAGALVRITAPFDATVEISYGERTANVRGLLAILALGAPAGSTVVVRASGPDAAAALRAAIEALASYE